MVPKYNARDSAVILARFNNCPVVLGSATPSFESMYNAETGKYKLLELPERIDNAKLLAKITQTVLIVFAVIIAIEQLNIATAFIAFAVNIILAAIGLGCALAFGLGCKDIAAKAMSDVLSKIKK